MNAAVAERRLTHEDLAVLRPGQPEYLNDDRFVYEVKWDGVRTFAGHGRLISRNGTDMTDQFPEIVADLAKLPPCAIDGELVIIEAGLPVFARVMRRFMRRRFIDAVSRQDPAVLVAFDLLELRGKDLRREPLEKRKATLEQLVARCGRIKYLEHFYDGAALFGAAEDNGFEGVVAKRRGSPYRAGRSHDWFKVKTTHGRAIDEERRSWNER